jgi:N-acetylmuramoyl-L-alanine amidase
MQELTQVDGEVEYAGLYEGTYTAQVADRFERATSRLFLQEPSDPSPGRQPERAEALANGTVTTVWQPVTQSYVEVKEDETPLFKNSWGARRLNYVDAKTRLEVIGRLGDKYRVRLGKSKSAWIPASQVRPIGPTDLPESLKNPREKGAAARIAGMALSGDSKIPEGVLLTLDLQQTDVSRGRSGSSATPRRYDRPLAMLAESPGAEYGDLHPVGFARSRIHRGSEKPQKSGALAEQLARQVAVNPLVEKIVCSRPDNLTVVFTLTLKCKEAWGCQIQSESTERVQLVPASPARLSANPAKPLQGIKVLISPGHGGMDSGAIGATGLTESDANLAVTLLLQKRLKAAGAQVETLREGDIYVSLDKHAEAIAQSDAHLLVSIHPLDHEEGDP